ncbi:MAG: hypothetical protein ACI8W8_001961 [Rhodothermales bacterium]|jgi:hypothetical protein
MTNEPKRRFLIKLLLFLSPFILAWGLPIYVMVAGGEFTAHEEVMQAQLESDTPVRYSAAFSARFPHYKRAFTNERKPQILVLGSSRSMQIRSRFFKPNYRFYSASGSVARIAHAQHFLEHIDKEALDSIEMIVLGVDQDFFNVKFDNGSIEQNSFPDSFDNDVSPGIVFKYNWLSVYKKLREGKSLSWSDCTQLHRSPHYGLAGKVQGRGFRLDGSSYYKDFIENGGNEYEGYPDYHFLETLKKIDEGKDSSRFSHSPSINPASLQRLEELLAFCQQEGIYVAGYLPGYATPVWEKMNSMSDKYGYLHGLPEAVGTLFTKYGMRVWDFSDIRSFGSSDAETIGGFHVSENAHLRMQIIMAEQDERFRKYSEDPNYLRKRLAEATNSYDVFHDEF